MLTDALTRSSTNVPSFTWIIEEMVAMKALTTDILAFTHQCKAILSQLGKSKSITNLVIHQVPFLALYSVWFGFLL